MNRTITADGVGQAKMSPDQVKLNIWIESSAPLYEDAINSLARRTAVLREDLTKLGFKEDDLKTKDFTVRDDIKYINNQQQRVGYIARQTYELVLNYEKDKLNSIIFALSNSQANPEFNVVFEVKDKRDFQDVAISDAVVNAMDNAKTIANASGVALGKILSIEYGESQGAYRSDMILRNSAFNEEAKVDINPTDVKTNASVKVVFEILE